MLCQYAPNVFLPALHRHPFLCFSILFLVTAFIFILYDCTVERRQRKIYEAAIKSAAVVESLFPKNVRERLLEERSYGYVELDRSKRQEQPREEQLQRKASLGSQQDFQQRKASMGSQARKSSMGSQARKSSMGSSVESVGQGLGSMGHLVQSPAKVLAETRRSIIGTRRSIVGTMANVTNTLAPLYQPRMIGGEQRQPPTPKPERSLPIADFFPETTVMFADIRGFTAWCSTRERTFCYVGISCVPESLYL